MFTASDLIYHPTMAILDAQDAAEVGRQRLLLDLITPVVGRLFPDEPTAASAGEPATRPALPSDLDLSPIRTVLDIGCGPGDWVLDLAYEHPELEAAGIDSSSVLIDAANLPACDQMLANASFGLVDLTHPPFDFSDASFDLITASFLLSRLEAAYVPPLLAECARLLPSGGWMLWVECEAGSCSSPAIETVSRYYAQAIARAGLYPILARRAYDRDGPGTLPTLLTEAGFQIRAMQRRRLSFGIDKPAYVSMRTVIVIFFELIKPFVLRMQVVDEATFTDLLRQAAREIRLPTFRGSWRLLVLWARKGEASEQAGQAEDGPGNVPVGGANGDEPPI